MDGEGGLVDRSAVGADLAIVFVTLRIIYIAMYVAGLPMIRSGIWVLALFVNAAIFFAGYK